MTQIQSWWKPDYFARHQQMRIARMRMIAALRDWFAAADFTEVDTPALQVSPGMEPHLKSFATVLHDPLRGDQFLHLHTSPEFTMKKLLVAGMEQIYQISHVFRNEVSSAMHHPEFTMLEWYRTGVDYTALMQDAMALVQAAARATDCTALLWQGKSCDPFAEWVILSVEEAFAHYAEIDLLACITDPQNPVPDQLAAEAQRIGIVPHEGDSFEDIFFRIMDARIEPHLGVGTPLILKDYPISMAALSRPHPDQPHLAQRFEVYLCGMELANAFGELTDAAEQARRFAADQALAERLYGAAPPLDTDFLAALNYGLPACSGCALGIDRLAMLCLHATDIKEILWAPVCTPPPPEHEKNNK